MENMKEKLLMQLLLLLNTVIWGKRKLLDLVFLDIYLPHFAEPRVWNPQSLNQGDDDQIKFTFNRKKPQTGP